ncbi:hypothetical protein CLV78_102562 [Aliiruegeria haliotis]|uniref:Uncharacterized protein n=1 Tax=Aliiruegeria haliotis TaxID=1280846 RepID=A0A2T0RW41_9RHOB|nr:hypothetical protein [Aliiruegeria haliotis]PRY25384.1 hypothetical protein CLV78_102562 [Aliiruegeria haliotis]
MTHLVRHMIDTPRAALLAAGVNDMTQLLLPRGLRIETLLDRIETHQ